MTGNIDTRSATVPEHIIKFNKEDPEKILLEELTKKFGKRFIQYRERYKKYLEDTEHKLSHDYPMTVVLELVNRCNLECVMCYQGWRNDASKSQLSENELDILFKDFKKNKLASLMISVSEPLLYKGIDKVLKRAEDAEIMDVFLFTNGTLLNKKNSEMILKSNITRLFVSIDGASKKSYDDVRVPVSKRLLKQDRLKDLENNIINFVKLRKSMKKKLPLVRTSFVALKENHHEIEKFRSKWLNIVDTVEIQREVSIEAYEKINLKKVGEKKLSNYNCQEPWGQIGIYSDGSVAPCCNIVGRNYPIGNIKNNTVSEIWNGKEMNKIRDGFLNNSPNKVCQSCIESSQSDLYKSI